MSKALALRTTDGRHIGAILFATEAEGPTEGHCVVMPLPSNASVTRGPEFQALARFGLREVGELRFVRDAQQIRVLAPEVIVLRELADASFEGSLGGKPIYGTWASKPD